MLNSKQDYHNIFKEGDTLIEQLSQGRSNITFPAVPSFDSNSTVDRHTEGFERRYSLKQRVFCAPALGIPVGSAAVSYSGLRVLIQDYMMLIFDRV